MKMNELSREELFDHIYAILAFQFSEQFATQFLTPYDQMKFKFSSKTGKLRYIYLDEQLQASYRAQLGNFSLSPEGATRVLPQIKFPQYRVQVINEVADFIKKGKSVFAKHIKMFDTNLRIGEEVFVVDEQDALLALGKLDVPTNYLPMMKSGSAVRVRKGAELLKDNE